MIVAEERISGLIKADQAAEYLSTTPARLANMRYLGEGPKYVRIGRSVRYRLTDLDEFIAANVQNAGR